jgi:hypothetical protein
MDSSWGAAQLSLRLHQLDPITKGIIDIKPIKPLQGLVSRYMVSRALQARRQLPQTLYDESGMGLSSRHKILLDAQMNFQRLPLEPTPAAYSEMWRLGDLGNSQHVLVKRPGFILTPGRHCKLNVVYVTDLHFLHPAWIVCVV